MESHGTGGAGFVVPRVAGDCVRVSHKVFILDGTSDGFPDPVRAHAMLGCVYTIFPPYNVYGECQSIGNRSHEVIRMFANMIKWEPLKIFGDGEPAFGGWSA
jgi:hypothetical protein